VKLHTVSFRKSIIRWRHCWEQKEHTSIKSTSVHTHPHKGYEGEVPELKVDCECRKPKPGLLLKAAVDFNIDLANSWMIGDGENDIKAGKAAGCKTALIGKGRFRSGYDIGVTSGLVLCSFIKE